jgi:hypothetical protein
MIEVLQQLVQQVGQKAVVENPAVPNALNAQTMELISGNLIQELTQKAGSVEGIQQIAGLLGSPSNINVNNPLIGSLIEKIAPTLTQNLNISPTTAQSVVESLIPAVMGLFSSKIADPNDSSISMESIVQNLAGNTDVSSIMGQIGSVFSDGKVDMNDLKGLTDKGGFGDLLGGFFGK